LGRQTIHVLVFQIATAPALIRASDALSTTLDRYDAGARDTSMRQAIFPDLATADRIMPALRHHD
jgi:hypothetical protein